LAITCPVRCERKRYSNVFESPGLALLGRAQRAGVVGRAGLAVGAHAAHVHRGRLRDHLPVAQQLGQRQRVVVERRGIGVGAARQVDGGLHVVYGQAEPTGAPLATYSLAEKNCFR
jgi:hypothetical protein